MMELFTSPDWQHMFASDTPLLEIFIRGSCMYLALFVMLRFILERIAGTLSISDLLMVVLIADAAQNGMANDYRSITDGLLLVATLIFWNFTLDWLAYHFPRLEKFIHPPPLKLVQHGKLLRKNMRRELITQDELMSHLREQNVHSLDNVKVAYMEGDGRISVCTYDEVQHAEEERSAL